MQAPFPYFGGKSSIANIVWEALGQPGQYIEPFFGSGAVLLNRPYWKPEYVETVVDLNCWIANVWRSIAFSPDKTAEYCDWPVNHVDKHARRNYMIEQEGKLRDGLASDPEWHDPKTAGYWIYCAGCWIGSGLTEKRKKDDGLCKIQQLAGSGKGVHNVSLCQMPHLTCAGNGVHSLSKTYHIFEWFNDLSARLRRVRIVCGSWDQVLGGNWQAGNFNTCGMFFDPPYATKDRSKCYHHDDNSIPAKVLEYAKKRGDDPKFRIVLAGYGEYEDLVENHGWSKQGWKANGGYGNQTKSGTNENRFKETLYFSPHCIKRSLFD